MEMTGFKSIGLLKNWRGDSEILARLVVTGLKLIGLLKKREWAFKFYNGWKWQDSHQWDYLKIRGG